MRIRRVPIVSTIAPLSLTMGTALIMLTTMAPVSGSLASHGGHTFQWSMLRVRPRRLRTSTRPNSGRHRHPATPLACGAHLILSACAARCPHPWFGTTVSQAATTDPLIKRHLADNRDLTTESHGQMQPMKGWNHTGTHRPRKPRSRSQGCRKRRVAVMSWRSRVWKRHPLRHLQLRRQAALTQDRRQCQCLLLRRRQGDRRRLVLHQQPQRRQRLQRHRGRALHRLVQPQQHQP